MWLQEGQGDRGGAKVRCCVIIAVARARLPQEWQSAEKPRTKSFTSLSEGE